MTDEQSWLDLVVEDAIDPALPIIDTHHHCWDVPPYPVFAPYDVHALAADKAASGHNVVATVYVDAQSHYREDGPLALRVVGETEWVDAMADEAERLGGPHAGLCAGIISRADLMLGAEVAGVLDAHAAAAPARFKGIRLRTAFDADNPFNAAGAGMMSSAAFHEGFAQLGPRGLSYDASLLHPQIPELIDLARRFPETMIILDHIGVPMMGGHEADRRDEIVAAWSGAMIDLADRPNVVVKLGGMNMPHIGLSFAGRDRPPSSDEVVARQRDLILRVIDMFGPERCMFESNFPVDRQGVGYGILWNAFKRIVGDFSAADRTALFSGTAASVYRLDAHRPEAAHPAGHGGRSG